MKNHHIPTPATLNALWDELWQAAENPHGSLVRVENMSQPKIPHGTLMRIGMEFNETRVAGNITENGGTKEWDLHKPWIGEELKGFLLTHSLYTRTKQAKFYAHENPAVGIGPLFILFLDEDTPREEGERIASSYMLMLNASRRP